MTAKRFTYNVNKNCIECNGKFVAYLNSVDGFRIANKLTVLAEENEQLKEAREYYQENFLTMKTERNQFKRENELLKFQLDECRNNKLFSRRELEKENEQLKEENEFAKLLANHRGEMVSFADSLIQDVNDELTQKMWYQFKEEMYQKWKKKRGIE